MKIIYSILFYFSPYLHALGKETIFLLPPLILQMILFHKLKIQVKTI